MKIIPEANWKEDMKVFRTAAADADLFYGFHCVSGHLPEDW